MVKITGNKDIYLTRGDDLFLDLEIRNRDYPYKPYILEDGDSVVFSVRKYKNENIENSNPLLFQIPIISNKIHISSDDTSSLPFGNYYFDVQITFKNGEKNTIIGPNILKICPEVTYDD